MNIKTRIKVRPGADGRSDVLVLINHPMESGLRRDAATGGAVPARYVYTLVLRLNGVPAAAADLGPAVSANPLTHFRLEGTRRGDVVSAEWTDTRGTQGRARTTIQ